jgi:hypothetical protein
MGQGGECVVKPNIITADSFAGGLART